MGRDVNVILPGNVGVVNVFNVIAKLLGNNHKWKQAGEHRWIVIEGICFNIPDHTSLTSVTGNIVNKIEPSSPPMLIYYSFECSHDDRTGRYLCIGRSSARNIALSRAIVDFFGGKVIYQDEEHRGVYEVPAKTADENSPTDGEPWYDFQEGLALLKPISQAQIDFCEKFAQGGPT